MAVARIMSRAQVGLRSPLVHVEVHLGSGLPVFSIVGLAATAVKESKERVRSALANSKFEFPAGRITVNLSPADVPKEGGRFDLPIALGVLIASGQLKVPESSSAVRRCEFYGELALGGELKPVRGMLLAAAHAGHSQHEMIVPLADADEAVIAARDAVRGAMHLLEVCRHLEGLEIICPHGRSGHELSRPVAQIGRDAETQTSCNTAQISCDANAQTGRALSPGDRRPNAPETPDLLDIRGQLQAKRALTVAAAGNHSVLFVGPPGSGKSMLAQRLPYLLPPLTDDEALEVAMIASASVTGFDQRSYGRRPFRSPHHTASVFAIVGGGAQAAPGEISLAHRGVLFLDELAEFDRRTLEALREPLETGVIAVSRIAMQTEYPAEFQLVAAMNPCPCGYRGDPGGRCKCTPGRLAQYRARVSGPLLDRIDLRVEVLVPAQHELMTRVASGDSTAQAAAKVLSARRLQLARAGKLNSRLTVRELNSYCRLDAAGERVFWLSQARLGPSARSLHHTLRVARTIADLESSDAIREHHVAEALQLKRAFDEPTANRPG